MTTSDSTPHDSSSSSHDSAGESSSGGSSDKETYRRVREDFDGMKFDKQATFLVDAAVSLLARGIESAGRAIASELDEMAEKRRKKGEPAGPFGTGEPEGSSSRSGTSAPDQTSEKASDDAQDSTAGDRSDPLSTPDAPTPSDEPPHG